MTVEKPIEIQRLEGSGLRITWADGAVTEVSNEILRVNCPCADCRIQRGDDTHSSPLTPAKLSLRVIEHTKEEEIALRRIWAVGQYALGLEWGDGHSTGIYPYPLLRELSFQDPLKSKENVEAKGSGA